MRRNYDETLNSEWKLDWMNRRESEIGGPTMVCSLISCVCVCFFYSSSNCVLKTYITFSVSFFSVASVLELNGAERAAARFHFHPSYHLFTLSNAVGCKTIAHDWTENFTLDFYYETIPISNSEKWAWRQMIMSHGSYDFIALHVWKRL